MEPTAYAKRTATGVDFFEAPDLTEPLCSFGNDHPNQPTAETPFICVGGTRWAVVWLPVTSTTPEPSEPA